MFFLLLTSCSTGSDRITETLSEGYYLSGMEAAETYSKLEFSQMDNRILYNLIYSYIEAKDFDSALYFTEVAIDKYPEYNRFHYLKAYIEREYGKYNSYINTLSEIIRADSANIPVRELKIKALSLLGRKDEAVHDAKELLKFDIGNKTALNLLALYSPFYEAVTGFKKEISAENKSYDRDYSMENLMQSIYKVFEEKKRVSNTPIVQVISYGDLARERLEKNNTVVKGVIANKDMYRMRYPINISFDSSVFEKLLNKNLQENVKSEKTIPFAQAF